MDQRSMTSVFYMPSVSSANNLVIEVKTGYLLKSPPHHLFRRESSWRRRYFVLYKSNDQAYQLKYFNSEQETDKPLGEIDLRQATVTQLNPYYHPRWKWAQKFIKFSPSCVVYIKTSAREYFLVGNNSLDVNEWFIALSNPCLQGQQKTSRTFRSMSEPCPGWTDSSEIATDSHPRPNSEPIYDYPAAFPKRKTFKESLYMHMDAVSPGDDVGLHTEDRPTRSVPQCFVKQLALTRRRFTTITASKMEATRNSSELKDVVVQRADLMEHLTLVDGTLSVSGWTGQPLALFQEGDRVLALNDLFTCSEAEFRDYLSKALKNKVKLTILHRLKIADVRRHSL